MPKSSPVFDAGTLEALGGDLGTWKARPFSAELQDFLKGSIADGNRGWALMTMLRQEDALALLADTDALQPTARAFNCFFYSGLFEKARVLLEESPALRRTLGVNRDLPPRYGDDPIAAFESAEAAARWDLWGVSKAARELWNGAARVANDTQEPLRILNVGLSGLSGSEKDKVAKAIHGVANRALFAVLGPEDEDPRPSLEGAMSGGALYLRVCDSLRDNVRSMVYAAFTSRVYEGAPVDALLIVDSPCTKGVGYQSGKMLGAGKGLSGALGGNVPGQWSFLPIPNLQKRIADVPLLVNKALERVQANDLADVRHHLACWLRAAILKSRVQLEVGWLENAVVEACEALCADWSPPIDSSSAGHGLTAEKGPSSVTLSVQEEDKDDELSSREMFPVAQRDSQVELGKSYMGAEPFPTPNDARWANVKMRFKDGYTLSVEVLGARGVYNYTQMGMVNKGNSNPTVQWELLRIFADEHGTFTWDSRHADKRHQKRRERLSKSLRAFFQIEGDPIERDGKGWRTLFQIEP